MAVTSTKTADPIYVEGSFYQETYLIEGIGSTDSPDVILTLGRGPGALPSPLPASGSPLLGLPQQRPQVVRFSQTKAFVICRWGVSNGSSGSFSPHWVTTRSRDGGFNIPLWYSIDTDDDSVPELYRTLKPWPRAQWDRIENDLISVADADAILQRVAEEAGKVYVISNIPHVLKSASVGPVFNGTQQIVTTVFFASGLVPSFAAGTFGGGHFVTPALSYLEEYAPLADGGTNITVSPVSELYPIPGNLGDLYWRQ